MKKYSIALTKQVIWHLEKQKHQTKSAAGNNLVSKETVGETVSKTVDGEQPDRV